MAGSASAMEIAASDTLSVAVVESESPSVAGSIAPECLIVAAALRLRTVRISDSSKVFDMGQYYFINKIISEKNRTITKMY